MTQFEVNAKQSSNDFNKIQLNEPTIQQPPKQGPSSSLKDKNFDDIEKLKNLNLNEENTKESKEIVNKNQVNEVIKPEAQTIDDWLDDVILD